jgi:hypothetical protein
LISRRGAAPSFEWQTGPAIVTDLTTYNFSTIAIGDAAPSRKVVVGIMSLTASGAASLTSITVGGVTASIEVASATGGREFAAIAIAAVPTGTTADIDVVFGDTMRRCILSVWATYDLKSSTAVDTAISAADPAALSVNTQNDGLIFGVGYNNTSSTGVWSGLTERFDVVSEGAQVTTADDIAASPETPRSISLDYATPDSERVAVAASFR